MTRPVGEPSIAKEQGAQDFGIRQLFRRPAPVSGDTIDYFRAYRYETDVVRTSGGSQTTVDWDFWEYCNTDVFTPLDTGLQPDPVPGVDKVRRVQLDGDGRYTFFFGALPDTVTDGSCELAMHDGDDTWGFPDAVYHAIDNSYGSAFLVFSLSRVYPMVDPFGGTNDVPQISFTVAQVSSATINFNPLWMEIHYESNVTFCPEGSS